MSSNHRNSWARWTRSTSRVAVDLLRRNCFEFFSIEPKSTSHFSSLDDHTMCTRRKSTKRESANGKNISTRFAFFLVFFSRAEKSRSDMMCDKTNGKLDCLTNNNNLTNGAEHQKPNGIHHKSSKAEGPPILEEDMETRKSLVILLSIFVASIGAMFYIYKNFPELEEWVDLCDDQSARFMNLFVVVVGRRRRIWKYLSTLKMQSDSAWCSTATKSFTTSKSWLAFACFIYCELSRDTLLCGTNHKSANEIRLITRHTFGDAPLSAGVEYL